MCILHGLCNIEWLWESHLQCVTSAQMFDAVFFSRIRVLFFVCFCFCFCCFAFLRFVFFMRASKQIYAMIAWWMKVNCWVFFCMRACVCWVCSYKNRCVLFLEVWVLSCFDHLLLLSIRLARFLRSDQIKSPEERIKILLTYFQNDQQMLKNEDHLERFFFVYL